jgi:ferritin-like metal-binding protein YciE
MAKAASAPQLKQALERHLEVTRRQAERLENLFETFGMPPKGKTCQGMKGLIEEGQEIVKDGMEPDVLDAGIIGAAQRVEHYEIAGYGTARTMAETLGMKKAAKLLEQTLKEEKAADEMLTRIAEKINVRALQVSQGETED